MKSTEYDNDVNEYLALCMPYLQTLNVTLEELKAEIKAYNTAFTNNTELSPHLKRMFDMWYKSLATDTPDYSVYGDPYYFAETWLCWLKYSRRYLNDIQKEDSLSTEKSIYSDIADSKIILDLGCGTGYTTNKLKNMFPLSQVYGTNIKDTYQFKIASVIAEKNNFSIVETYDSPVDLIFASEFFEHIDEPLVYLRNVISKNRPKYMLIANAFTQSAIGHFHTYKHEGKNYTGKEMSKMFNNTMKELGYVKQSTNLWNNRPSYWKLHDFGNLFEYDI